MFLHITRMIYNLDHRITYQATINACEPSDKLQIKNFAV